jgi:hypothetical protein
MASIAAKLLAGAAGKKAYEKSGLKKVVHKIPVIGQIASLFGFQHGGRVPRTGIYKLHKGEMVIPSRTANALSKRPPRKVKIKAKAKSTKRRKVKKR